jgi:nitrate reductase gamma subunit
VVSIIIGVVLCLVGAVWIGQGVGAIHGSFMTGEAVWAVIGGVALLFGVSLLVGARRARRSRIDDAD